MKTSPVFSCYVERYTASASRSDFPPPHVAELLQARFCGTVPLTSCQSGGHFELLQGRAMQNVCLGEGNFS